MRWLVVAFCVLAISVAPVAMAQTQPNDVAHGGEKDAHAIAHPNEGHGEGGGEPESTFGIPTWIFKLVNMITFIAVLVYFLRKPVAEAFRAKGESVRAAVTEAKARREKADQLASDIQNRLSQIEQEVSSIIERARQEGERQKRELIAAAEAEGQKILENARVEVENRVKSARHELTEMAGQLATERAEQILRKTITEADQKKLFKESLAQIAEVQR